MLTISPLERAAQAREKKPPQGGLWVGGDIFISEFQGNALVRSGKHNPNLRIGNPNFGQALGLAFDQTQNLWFIYYSDLSSVPQIVEISHGEIAAIANGEEGHAKVLADSNSMLVPFSDPLATVFDPSGDLWVSDLGRDGVMEFLPDQIAASGSPTPTVFITAPNFSPGAMRFDNSANLWVAEDDTFHAVEGHLWRFAPSDRVASGTPDPSLVVDLPSSFAAEDLAFDSSGNLWAAGRTTDTSELLMFSAPDISGNGEISPSPAVTITSSAFGVPGPLGTICLAGLDFDSVGDLWLSEQANQVDCVGTSQIMRFNPDQLNTNGDLTPAVILGNRKRKNLPGQIRFGPKVQ